VHAVEQEAFRMNARQDAQLGSFADVGLGVQVTWWGSDLKKT
jgi:hypothetical protein